MPNGAISDERSTSVSVADDGDPFSLGNSATLMCLPGYVTNTDSFERSANVECVADDVKGAIWMYTDEKGGHQAKCIRGAAVAFKTC